MDTNTESTTETVATRRGRPPIDFAARLANLEARGIKPIALTGRPLVEVKTDGALAMPVTDFEGRERLDKRARTIAGVAARGINEAAGKTNADTAHAVQYITAQVVQLLSNNL